MIREYLDYKRASHIVIGCIVFYGLCSMAGM